MDDAVMTVAETSAYLKTDEEIVKAMIRDGELPHVRFGPRKVVVPRQPLDEWLRSEAFQSLKKRRVLGLVAEQPAG